MCCRKLIARDDDPGNQVNQKTWDSAWDQGDEKGQAEPEWAEPKEFAKASANTRKDPVSARAS
jgi:hypothetical protein